MLIEIPLVAGKAVINISRLAGFRFYEQLAGNKIQLHIDGMPEPLLTTLTYEQLKDLLQVESVQKPAKK